MMSGKKGSSGKITLGMLKGKSITTSVPSFAIRFHADDEELEEIYPNEDVDDDSERKGEEECQQLPTTTTASVAATTVAATTIASAIVDTVVSNTASSTITVTSSGTAASSRDPSPMKEYLKGLGKRSTSVDVGVLDASSASGSDTWRIFHELRGKITKTVEEKISEMKSDRRSGSLSFSDIGRSSKLIGKSKENSSISDSEDISETSGKAMEQKDGAKADPSPKRSSIEKLSKKGSSSIEEKDDVDEDSKSTTAQDEASEEGPTTPVQCETDSLSELTDQPKKLSFHAKFRSNLSGLRHRHHSHKPTIISSITMSSLASTKEDEKTENTIEDDIESGVEASEDINILQPVIAYVDCGRSDYTKFIPSSHSVQMKKKEHVFKFVGCFSWKWYIVIISIFLINLYAPLPNFVLGFINGLLTMYIIFYISKLFNQMFVPAGVQVPRIGEAIEIPDYSTMPILEVPPVKEYYPLTKYAGWMNEYPGVYDPSSYHISETQSVYIRLEGGTLRMSHPRSRIPKRAMWNERRHRLRFSHQRIYSIAGCEIKLLPDGLARKRIWSKKYPICIALQKTNGNVENGSKESGEEGHALNILEEHSELEIDSTEYFDPVNDNPSLGPVAEEDDEFSGELSDDDTFCHIEKSTTDHSRLYLFARTDREKEDWFRRFASAAVFASSPINQEEKPAVVTPQQPPPSPPPPPPTPKVATGQTSSDADVTALLSQAASTAIKSEEEFSRVQSNASMMPHYVEQSNFTDYTRFMSQFDLQLKEPGSRFSVEQSQNLATHQESQLRHDEALEPETEQDTIKETEKESQVSGSVMWINALIGRILFDILGNEHWVLKFQDRIQRKLSTIKLPVFLEELLVSELDVGDTIPLIHRASLPVLDERGLWVDLDISYQGLCSLTLETKLNLMKLKKFGTEPKSTKKNKCSPTEKRGSPMFDSDLDDSAESSDEESEAHNKSTSEDEVAASQSGGAGKRILRMVSRIAASRYFQQATEYKYIKKAMEEVSNTRLLLSVELRGLVGTLTLNIPPPPSDRLWYGFRENPKIWLSARPKLGERRVNISHVIAWIEKKLLEEVQKKFVLPNMDDLVIPTMTTDLPYQEQQFGNKPQ